MPASDHTLVVWSEIPVTDLAKAVTFYNKVFQWNSKVTEDPPNPMAVFDSNMETVGGHLYPGTPAKESGPTIHLMVPGTLEEAIDRCWDAGGRVLGEPIEIPAGRFAYATDLDGNSIGLFEPKAEA